MEQRWYYAKDIIQQGSGPVARWHQNSKQNIHYMRRRNVTNGAKAPSALVCVHKLQPYGEAWEIALMDCGRPLHRLRATRAILG